MFLFLAKKRKKIVYILGNLLVILVTLLWLLPIIWMLVNSFRPETETFYTGIFPQNYTLDNIKNILSDVSILRSFKNSAIVAISSAILSSIFAALAAYGFSRFKIYKKDSIQVALLIAKLFPVIVLSIAFFRLAGKLKIYDTFIPLILVNAVINMPFAIWILRDGFDGLPIELEESAWIDGATRLGGIVRILLPIMLPTFVATLAFIFLLSWNEYLFAMSFIRTPEKVLMTVTMANNMGLYHMNYVGLMTHGMLATLPLLIIFIWMQKHIIRGLTSGAVRG